MKTLKSILETYTPKSADEKRFVDKHVVVKHADRNGNGDDVFKAKKIKTIKRSPEHGHDVDKDHLVYEANQYEVHVDYGPHQSKRHVVTAGDEKSAQKKALVKHKAENPHDKSIMIAGWKKLSEDTDFVLDTINESLKSRFWDLAGKAVGEDHYETIQNTAKTLHDKGMKEINAKFPKGHPKRDTAVQMIRDLHRHVSDAKNLTDLEKRSKPEVLNKVFAHHIKALKEDVEITEAEALPKGAKHIGDYSGNLAFFRHTKDDAAYEAATAHLKDLRSHKRRGIPHPKLGRIPKGADIAGAENDAAKYSFVYDKTKKLNEDIQIDEVSKDLLKRYVAAGDKSHNKLSAAAGAAWLHRGGAKGKRDDRATTAAAKLGKKAEDRMKHLNKAETRLGEEVESLQEHRGFKAPELEAAGYQFKSHSGASGQNPPSTLYHHPELDKHIEITHEKTGISGAKKKHYFYAGKWGSHNGGGMQSLHRNLNDAIRKNDGSLKEETVVEATATIHSPGNRMHGKVGRVFHDHGDGRINVQVTNSMKKGDVTNLTLKKGEYKLNEDAAGDVLRASVAKQKLKSMEGKKKSPALIAKMKARIEAGKKYTTEGILSHHTTPDERRAAKDLKAGKESYRTQDGRWVSRPTVKKIAEETEGLDENYARLQTLKGLIGKFDKRVREHPGGFSAQHQSNVQKLSDFKKEHARLFRSQTAPDVREETQLDEAPYYSLQASKERMAKEKARAAAKEAIATAKKNAAEARKTAKSDQSGMIARHIETEVGNHYPDSDGFDAISNKLKKMGIHEYDAIDHMNRAARKHLGAKSFSHYVDNFHKDAQGSN